MDVKFTLGLDFPNLPYYMEKDVICALLNIWTTFEGNFPGCNAQNRRRWAWPARTQSSGTSAARTTCAGTHSRRWSALIWLQSKSWIWGEVCTTKMVEVDQSLFAFLLKIFFTGTMLYTSSMTGMGLKLDLVSFDEKVFHSSHTLFTLKMLTMNILLSTKCSHWIAHLTQETTWKSSNWLWRQSPTSLATGSKSTSSLNLQTNFTFMLGPVVLDRKLAFVHQ